MLPLGLRKSCADRNRDDAFQSLRLTSNKRFAPVHSAAGKLGATRFGTAKLPIQTLLTECRTDSSLETRLIAKAEFFKEPLAAKKASC